MPVRTRLAVYDRRKQRPTIRVETCRQSPTFRRPGPIRLWRAGAVEAIKADPVGAIHDLKSRLGGTELVRDIVWLAGPRGHLIVQLFAELRETALRQADIGDALTDCCLAIPLQFDTRQSELLQEAARFRPGSRA